MVGDRSPNKLSAHGLSQQIVQFIMLVTKLLTTWQSNELLKHRAHWIQLRVRTTSEGPPVNTCVHSYSLSALSNP